jgi:hypothetical protein
MRNFTDEETHVEFTEEDHARVSALIYKEKIKRACALMASRGETEVMNFLKSKGVTGEKAVRSWEFIKKAAQVWREKNQQ